MAKLIPGVNDLLTCNPELAKEYDSKKNKIPVNKICAQSAKNVWWICSNCGHSFQKSPNRRNFLNNNGTCRKKGLRLESCPKCSMGNHTSFNEQAIYFYIKKYFPDSINSYKSNWLGKRELDIFIPSLNVAIEYDGESWHRNINKDIIKSNLCKDNGIKLIRIRENKCSKISDYSIKIIMNNNSYSELEKSIYHLLSILNVSKKKKLNIDISKDSPKILKQYKFKKVENSIASNKQMLKEFSPNNLVLPENISLHSGIECLWVCDNGHEYKMTPDLKSRPYGCPYCSNQRVLKGYNDVATTNPEILKIWDYDKNVHISPYNITRGSQRKIWWRCPDCNASGYRQINHITHGHICPYCARKKLGGRKVICVETNTVYNSITEAVKSVRISRSCISACCRGNQKTAGGYTWKYYKEV